MNDLFQDILKNKENDINRNKFLYAPNPYEIDWTIKEARGYGIPHAVFFDTVNKITVFPDHIPDFEACYDTNEEKVENSNFDGSYGAYGWRESGEEWICSGCENCRGTSDRNVRVFKTLRELRNELRQKGTVCNIITVTDSDCKGHTSVEVDFDENSGENVEDCDHSLWIYTTSNDLMNLM